MSAPLSPWGSAPALLAEAGAPEDPPCFRSSTGEDEKAVRTVPMRIRTAWTRTDADMFAGVVTENGSLLTSRAGIHASMPAGFSGPPAGEDPLAPERKIRATWIVPRRSGQLELMSHQSSPIAG